MNKVEESFNVINSGTKPLAAYLFTADEKFKQEFVMNVSAGGLLINDTVLHVIFFVVVMHMSLLFHVSSLYLN